MKKKVPSQKVVTINEKLIESTHKDIVDAIVQLDNDENLISYSISNLTKIRDNGDKDINYILDNGEKEDAINYIITRRQLLTTEYNAYVMNITNYISNSIAYLLDKYFNIYSINYDRLKNIIYNTFGPDPRVFMFSNQEQENILDLTMYNNIIPNTVIQIITLLESNIQKYEICRFNHKRNDYDYDSINDISPEQYGENILEINNNLREIVGEMIHNILVQSYLYIKEITNNEICDLGYPGVKLDPADVQQLISK